MGDDGKLVKGYEYDEYGNTTDGGEESFINEVTFTGSVRDLGSGLQYMNARYYDPATGRFVSQDTYTGTPYAPWTQHLYSYCGNNPVNMVDPTGHMPIQPMAVCDGGTTRVVPEPQESGEDNTIVDRIKDIIKSGATELMPIINRAKETFSQLNLTWTRGVSVSGTPSFWNFNAQLGISMDTKGNIALQRTLAGGITGGTPGISLAAYNMITNAPTIEKLEGEGYQVGGSLGVPVYYVPLHAGAEVNIIPDEELNDIYFGATGSLGFGVPGGELHVEWGETITLAKLNIFDLVDEIYTRIMEW